MSEVFHVPKNSLKKKAIRVGGALTVAAAFYSAGVATDVEFFHNANNGRQTAIEAAQAELLAKDFAQDQARNYAEALNRPHTSVPMQILNGEVDLLPANKNGLKGGAPVSYKNPILLAALDPSAKPDTAGNFLVGSWLGIQGADANGQVTLQVIPFSPKNFTFKPYDANKIVYNDLAVYATEVDNTAGQMTGHELIAYDPTGEKHVTNPDGTLIQPGLVEEPKILNIPES